ncbi:Sec-independent protein translocase TatA [Cryobacterium adonitolivorans]|uniref:Sec-independent protein translocase protein TatA n=1 Tax=Cryobacterium adonitolivorans TaxID=1259189 RepID=A0A4R8W5P7_9MICO|nr:twin-arginine translocase TatA/TatE family subunit [Cryobacterium adonitolivorans]TFC03154.1 Sec-independent protein translocase TatA [Cryobacterium adonitolivorans]
MLGNLTGWHFLIILAILLLLFGAPKLPALARSVGQSMKILKSETRVEPEDDKPTLTAVRQEPRVETTEQPGPARPSTTP